MPEQAGVPGQAAAEAQETFTQGKDYSGGSGMLDAEIEASQNRLGDEVLDQPAATNIVGGDTDTDDPADAKNFTTTGAYPADQERLGKDYSSSSKISNQDTTT